MLVITIGSTARGKVRRLNSAAIVSMCVWQGKGNSSLTEGREHDLRRQRPVLCQDEYGKGRAGDEKGSSVPGEIGNSLSGTNFAQILELLLVANMVESVHEGLSPGVQLDGLHVVDDFVDESASSILVLHLALLHLLHKLRNEALNRHHHDHDNDTGHHRPANQVIQGNHANNDLERGRPSLLRKLSKILKPLSVYGHVIDNVACCFGGPALVRQLKRLSVNGRGEPSLDAHASLECSLEILVLYSHVRNCESFLEGRHARLTTIIVWKTAHANMAKAIAAPLTTG